MKQNTFLRDFRAQIRNRFADDSDAMSMSEWITRNTRLRKKAFSFKGYEFQRQIIDDMHPNMAVIKCSQIGLTEVQIRKNLAFLARNLSVSTIFTLPDDSMYKRVSQTRVGPLVQNERVFNLGAEKPIRSMALYQINQSFGYFVGNKESDATSINADALFHDEVDLSDQEMLALFQSRLQGSDYRITQGFSTPTFEGFGIHASFSVSDQHEYMVRCTKCRHDNIPAFTPGFIRCEGLSTDINNFLDLEKEDMARIDFTQAVVMCEKCHNPLDMEDPDLRQWVPRFPGRKTRGYRVSPFCTPRLTTAYIFDQLEKYKQRDAIRRFYNTVLGEAYNDSNARLTDADILAVMGEASVPHIPDGTPVILGGDMGITCHLVLLALTANGPVVFKWEQVNHEQFVHRIQQILTTYNVVGGLVDRHPYTPTANEIRDLSHGRLLPNEYSGTPNAAAVQLVKDELDSISHVRSNRTVMIDAVASAIRKGKIRFEGYGHLQSLITHHLKDMVRVENEDQSAVWQKIKGEDHFFHALAYALHAIRVHIGIDYKTTDQRSLVAVAPLVISVKNEPKLSMKSRIHHPTLLGAI